MRNLREKIILFILITGYQLSYTQQNMSLWYNKPPFQIDRNFGGAAGVIEMLLQSTGKEIFLLPALPDAWPSGSIKGICARGGFEISMSW